MKTSNFQKRQTWARRFRYGESDLRGLLTIHARYASAVLSKVLRAQLVVALRRCASVHRPLLLIALLFFETVPSAACEFGEDQCAFGFVWREAFPGDHVCVAGTVARQAAVDNAAAEVNHLPNSNACLPGLVWREAEPDDQVCVPGATRAQAAADNAAALSRRDQSCKETMTPESLSVLSLNVGGSGGGTGANEQGIHNEVRMRRVAIWAKRHRVSPEVIALQEAYG